MKHIKVEDLDEKTFLEFKERFDKNYKVRFGAEDITIPENTRVIIDGDIIIFEEKKEKPKFEIGWYKNKEFSNHILCRGLNDFCGFDKFGQWHDELFTPIIQRFEEADPKEVTRLLTSEAEKRGFTAYPVELDKGVLYFGLLPIFNFKADYGPK